MPPPLLFQKVSVSLIKQNSYNVRWQMVCQQHVIGYCYLGKMNLNETKRHMNLGVEKEVLNNRNS